MKKFLALLLALAMMFSLVACGASKTEEPANDGEATDTIKIGALLPLSGSFATSGNTLKTSLEYAVDMINNEFGGIQNLGGAKLEIVYGDTQADPEVAVTEFERLINKEKVDILVGGHNTGVANTLSQYVIANDAIMVMDGATGGDAYTVENDNVYHVAMTNGTFQVDVDAQEQFRKDNFPGYKGGKVYCSLYAADDVGRTAFQTLLDNKDASGVDEIIGIGIESGATDLSSQLSKLKGRSDVEYISPTVGTQDAQLFLKQCKEYDITIPIFAGGAGFMVADFLEQVGDAGDYIYSYALWMPDYCRVSWDPEKAYAVNDYCYDKLGYYTDESWSYMWEAIWTIWDVLERTASMDKADLKDAFKATNITGDHMALLMSVHESISFETVTATNGVTYYNQNPNGNLLWGMAKDGAYHIVWPEKWADPEYPWVYPLPSWSER